jgi:peptidoglycan/LPS O-acetylase OafA/YrhL
MATHEGVRSEAGYIPAIEGMRGIAVLWVILFHYVVVRDGHFDDPAIAAISAVHPLNVLVRNGYLGVDLFFLITGFLLTLPWFMRAQRGAPATLSSATSMRAVSSASPPPTTCSSSCSSASCCRSSRDSPTGARISTSSPRT